MHVLNFTLLNSKSTRDPSANQCVNLGTSTNTLLGISS